MNFRTKHLSSALYISFIFILFNCHSNTTPDATEPGEVFYRDTQFVMGADLSYVNALLEAGAVYRDSSGNEKNPYDIFYSLGTNVVRVRKWHTPSWQIGLYGRIRYHEANDVAKTIEESKKAGMKVLLDFHYSDNWADPHKQETPAAWKGLALPILADSVYQYTYRYLTFLEARNLVPEYIQIGNENNGGICYPAGQIVNGNFTNFCTLLAAGSKAIRDFSNQTGIRPKILIHVAQFQHAKWWVEGIQKSGVPVDYDIIGISHYYKWSEVNNPEKIKASIRELINITKKDLWVVETAFPWTTQNKDNYPNILSSERIPSGYTVSKASQNKYLQDLTQNIIDAGGKGIIYWEPAWISSNLRDQWNTGSAWENAAFFDYNHKAHATLKFLRHPYHFK